MPHAPPATRAPPRSATPSPPPAAQPVGWQRIALAIRQRSGLSQNAPCARAVPRAFVSTAGQIAAAPNHRICPPTSSAMASAIVIAGVGLSNCGAPVPPLLLGADAGSPRHWRGLKSRPKAKYLGLLRH